MKQNKNETGVAARRCGTAKVDEADALFMIGSCAAFVSHLVNKARAAGLLSSK